VFLKISFGFESVPDYDGRRVGITEAP